MEVMEIAKVTSSEQTALAIEKIQNDFDGEADRLGLREIEDVVRLVKEFRATRDEERKYACNA